MASGTLGWKTKPSAMPMTSAAIPIMLRRLLSLGPNLLGELDIPDRAGRQRKAVGNVDGDADAVGDLQQPQTLQTGAVVEGVSHRVRRPDGKYRVGAAGGVVVDQDRATGLPDGHIRPDPGAADRDGLG